MLAFSHVVHFFAHKFSSLRAGRFSLAGILTSAFDCFFFRHTNPPPDSLVCSWVGGIEEFL